MNKVIVAILLAFISQFSFGQQKIRKNEMSISFLQIAHPTNSFYNYRSKVTPDFGINLFYKRRVKEGLSFRVNQSYSNYQINNPFQDCTMGSGVIEKINYKMITTSFGYEKRWSVAKKVKIYYGIDLTSFLFQTKTKYIREYPRIYGINNAYSLGLQPFAGISFYPKKRIVVALESSLNISYGKEFYKSLDMDGKIINNFTYSPHYFYSLFLPLRSASIGWLF